MARKKNDHKGDGAAEDKQRSMRKVFASGISAKSSADEADSKDLDSCWIGALDKGYGRLSEGDGEDFLAELTGEQEASKPEVQSVLELIPKMFVLTDRCLQFGYMMGPAVKEADSEEKLAGRDLEVGGFYLVNMGDDKYTFRDFIIPEGLPVTSGSIRMDTHYPATALEVEKLNTQNKTDYRLGAMMHVHPYASGGLYHSGVDDEALESLIDKMAKTTRRVHHSAWLPIESKIKREYGDTHLALKGDDLTDAIIKLVYPSDEAFFEVLQEFGFTPDRKAFSKKDFLAKLLEGIDHQTEEPRSVSIAASFVFNNNGDVPYLKVGIEERLRISRTASRTYVDSSKGRLKLGVIDKGVDIPTEAEVVSLMVQRVEFPARYTSWTGKVFSRFGHEGELEGKGAYAYDGTHWVITKSGDLTPAASGKSTSYHTAGFATSYTRVKKSADNKYTDDEFAAQFALSVASYLCEYRQAACMYSQYMSRVIKRMVQFNIVPELKAAVRLEDNFHTDGEEVGKPEIQFYELRSLAENVAKSLGNGSMKDDTQAIAFISDFISSDTIGRNKLIEEYVASVHCPLPEPPKEASPDFRKVNIEFFE